MAQLNPGALAVNIWLPYTNNWGLPSGGFYGPVSRSIVTNTSYSVVFSDTRWPSIYATGYVTLPDISATLKRVVCVATTNVPLFNVAMAARTNINMNGKWDSPPTVSILLIPTSASMASIPLPNPPPTAMSPSSTATDLGNHSVAGDVYLGPTATLTSGANQVSGNVYTDYNYDFPDVAAPDTSGWLPPAAGGGIIGILGALVTALDGNSYTYVFNNSGDYKIGNLGGSIYIATNAHVRLLVQNGSIDKVVIAGSGNSAGNLTMYSCRLKL